MIKIIFKILLLLTLLFGLYLTATSQTINANLFKGNIVRIADSLNLKGDYSYFGTNGILMDFRVTSGGRFLYRMNGSTDLLDFDRDNDYWTFYKGMLVNGDIDITGTFKINGVAIASSAIDTNKYFSIYRLDTSKYFNAYRLDTTKIIYTAQQNGYTLFDSIYNGRLITNGDLFMVDGGNIVWRTTPQMSISGQVNEIIGTAHKFNYYTQYGTQLAYIDSTTGIYTPRNIDADGNLTIDGWTRNGSSAPSLKEVLVRFRIGDTTNKTYTYPHGITPYTAIISYQVLVFNDSTAVRRWIPPGYSLSSTLTYTNYFVDSTVCSIFIPTGSVNLMHDTCFFYIKYHQ
ncbi:MAG: hypothetical protein JNJ56_11310 [Ignavibacteria bacterium]|nr:hypothetical protein [Ignavibacteria bacterium]